MTYRLRFEAGEWRVYDPRGNWADRFTTLVQAHTWATQCAIVDELCSPGGLTRFKAWKDIVFGPYEWVFCERNDDG
jgi:hypothetical protein